MNIPQNKIADTSTLQKSTTMSDQEEKLQQFIAITGSNSDRAKFFLESSAWDVEVSKYNFLIKQYYVYVLFLVPVYLDCNVAIL